MVKSLVGWAGDVAIFVVDLALAARSEGVTRWAGGVVTVTSLGALA